MSPDPPPRLTPAGLVAGSIAAATTATGLVLLSGPVLVAGLSALLFLFFARSFAKRHLDGFTVERDLPRRARAGESFPMEIRLRPGPVFPGAATLRLTDPLAPALRERPIDLETRECRSLRCTGLSQRRGSLPRRPWTLLSTWPLGLFLTERQGYSRDDHSTLVLPKPWLPPRLRERLDRFSAESAERPLEPADPLAEFRLLREFRNGDPVRGIHWPASLRTGRLQFAETEPPRPRPRAYGLLLHSYEPPGSVIVPETYELILRIATGLLLRFQREEVPVVFCQAPGTPLLLADRESFTRQLDGLALSRRLPQASMETVLAATMKGSGDPFAACDEVFVLGDGSLSRWETEARGRFPRSTCLDTTRLTTSSRPTLRTPAHHRP